MLDVRKNHSKFGGNQVVHEQTLDQKCISDAIAEFIITDLQLPEVVESIGFQRLVATLKSPCEIPSKLRLIDDIIPKIYDTYRETIMMSLSASIGEYSLSVEEWQSATGDIYVTFSVHSLQQGIEDQLQSKVMQTFLCSDVCDSDHWGQLIKNLLASWNLNKWEKIKAVIVATEQESILTAFKTLGFVLIPCLMFTLQRVCIKGCFNQKRIGDVLSRVRFLLYVIYRNRTALATLRLQETLTETNEIPLVTDYPKVWISTYVMLEQFFARRSVVTSILEGNILSDFEKECTNITDEHWSIIEDVLTILEPFKVTTMTLAEEKASLISLVKPLLWQLVNVHLKTRDTDSELSREIKSTLLEMLKDKYSEEGVAEVLNCATSLDPRFKHLPYAIEEAKAMMNGPIKLHLCRLITESSQSEQCESISESPQPSKKPRLSGMEFLLGDLCTVKKGILGNKEPIAASDKADLEISLYESEPTAKLDLSPLIWWQSFRSKVQNLALVASSYNCIPATATPPLRIPVDAQISFDMKRARLSGEIADIFLFLNANYNF